MDATSPPFPTSLASLYTKNKFITHLKLSDHLQFSNLHFTVNMASITMTSTAASLISNMNMSERRSIGTNNRGLLIVAKASDGSTKSEQGVANLSYKVDETSKKGNNISARRDLMFAAAAAAACSIAGAAFADGQPKAGTDEARKVYAPVCVSMPTARICRN